MIEPINRTPQILKSLEEKGGVQILNTEENRKAFREINKTMERIQLDSKRKQALSEESAKKVFVS